MNEAIDFNGIKGYSALSEDAKTLFRNVYKTHQSGFKSYGQAVSVKEEKRRLKVSFETGEYLYYYPDGTWG